MRRTVAVVTVALVAIGALSTGIAIAAGGDDDRPLTRSTLENANVAALEHTGGGTVIETEVGDDGAAYGIEVRRDDGSVVELSLDESFRVIGDETDDDGADDRDEAGEND
jgi:uncharacterized membrane protein YkoI